MKKKRKFPLFLSRDFFVFHMKIFTVSEKIGFSNHRNNKNLEKQSKNSNFKYQRTRKTITSFEFFYQPIYKISDPQIHMYCLALEELTLLLALTLKATTLKRPEEFFAFLKNGVNLGSIIKTTFSMSPFFQKLFTCLVPMKCNFFQKFAKNNSKVTFLSLNHTSSKIKLAFLCIFEL